jgi:hypothetical protein
MPLDALGDIPVERLQPFDVEKFVERFVAGVHDARIGCGEA